MRHGKAADSFGFKSDFERPLVARGIKEAEMAAEKLKIIGIIPDLIIASSAKRTQETAAAVSKIFGWETNTFKVDPKLYAGSLEDYIQSINRYDSACTLIIGHNPEIGKLAMHFSNAEISNYPTSAVSAFQFGNTEIGLNDKPDMVFYDLRDKE